MFRTTKNCGFQIVFENKFTLSVQFGPLSYCSNRDSDLTFDKVSKIQREKPDQESKDAEIAILDQEGKFLQLAYDQVQSSVSPKAMVLVAYELLMPVPNFDRIRDILVKDAG